MKWTTAISTDKEGEHLIWGEKLSALMQEKTFTESTFFLLTKRLPTQKELKMFDMLLISSIEHGIAAPSIFSARVSASVGNPLNATLAAGLLATGEWHGGAVEKCAYHLQSNTSAEDIVTHALAQKERLPGFGHKIYKDKDPRAEELLEAATKLGIAGVHTQKVRAMAGALQAHKPLALNIDGAMAAILSDMGFSWRIVNGCFLLGRLVGMMAHIDEELANEKPYRRLDDTDIIYTG